MAPGTVSGYAWSLGDESTSTAPSPAYTYTNAATYTVSLTATGPGGTNTKTQNGYITVSSSSGGGGENNAGLVGAYNFEEASGSTVVDASGKGNTGTISGATWTTQGRFGRALSFDGVNDWVTINDAASLDLTTSMTLEAWVYPTVNMTQWATVVLKEQPGGGLYELYANGDRSQPLTSVTVGGQYRVLSAGPWLLANQWTHLAATYDGTTQRLYVNGTQVAQRSQTGPTQVSSSPLRLGGNSVWGEFFKGRIDEVRVYNRVLSAAAINDRTAGREKVLLCRQGI
ncbi:MAG: PKD domain-containing protein [Pseudomonadota bacterium]|nr:PKD domain-containing protein [Gammaproteobacteria bacterium]MDQ3580591.1 PKD domain-containing protein [Pseudomonadota bacterium]